MSLIELLVFAQTIESSSLWESDSVFDKMLHSLDFSQLIRGGMEAKPLVM